jgi:hypothetical protein
MTPIQSIAVVCAVSFGDFVIAHSVLHRIEDRAKSRVRLIACSHLGDLNAILPPDVPVTLVESGENRVPAVFDVRKCGAWAAVQSAYSLRGRFQQIPRRKNEVLAFHLLGVRERFIAGRWPVIAPRTRFANVYETYSHFFGDQEIRTSAAPSLRADRPRTVGIFPESRLGRKRLLAPTLSVIFDRVEQAGLEPKLFILDGDPVPQENHCAVVNISRNFESLATAIKSVDCVISADSLPGHLAEYFIRPVFVALSVPNEYWLPYGCFTDKRWGIFGNRAEFSSLLDRFLVESMAA